jgi:hypothetical protein
MICLKDAINIAWKALEIKGFCKNNWIYLETDPQFAGEFCNPKTDVF